MNAVVIQAVLQALLSLMSSTGLTSKTVSAVLVALDQLVPVLVKEYTELLPIVKNIIAVLSTSEAVTEDQLTAAQSLDAQCDAAFDAAIAAYDLAKGETNG